MKTLIRQCTMTVAVVVSLGLVGCATTTANNGEMAALADRVSALEAKLVHVEATANAASLTASEALEAVDRVEACCDANTERMNRMFEKASSK